MKDIKSIKKQRVEFGKINVTFPIIRFLYCCVMITALPAQVTLTSGHYTVFAFMAATTFWTIHDSVFLLPAKDIILY
ncbi:hypothetical protein Barb4_02764 [Bacteroidales bacterium Barb4]|nr:hypothetical protein Barb4_02764 [Bacteroidales bacterium Barb4]